MTITASIIADSISEKGNRLTTLQLRYPRFIHAEFMTHRMFSRNASSSRAIPVAKLIEDIKRDPAMPLHWGRNQPGMQAREELDARVSIPVPIASYSSEDNTQAVLDWNHELFDREEAWSQAMDQAIMHATCFDRAGYHKQIVNRLLEPFSHINVVVTATEWDNFFQLRCHPDAQPEIRVLAELIREEMNNSLPNQLVPGQWHLPYVTTEEVHDVRCLHGYSALDEGVITRTTDLDVVRDTLIKASVARCARVSYLTHEGKTPDMRDDIKLFDRLVGSVPLHASPAEHQATPDHWYRTRPTNKVYGRWGNLKWHGNFKGWNQYRKILETSSS